MFNSTPRPMALTAMPPMKIKMMLHFYAVIGRFAPEEERRSESYTQFVRELLHEGMIERPSHDEREQHLGWAYRATEKGRVYVQALTQVPLPVQVPVEPIKLRWAMPLTPNPRGLDIVARR